MVAFQQYKGGVFFKAPTIKAVQCALLILACKGFGYDGHLTEV